MENKAHALAAGIFVLITVALLAALAAWLTLDRRDYVRYEISTRESLTGLYPQAPVRLRGVNVGKVKKVEFDEQTPGNVLLTLQVDEDAPLTQSTYATLGTQGVTGVAFIQLDDATPGSPRLVPNKKKPPRIPLKPSFLAQLRERGEEILEKVETITNNLAVISGPDNQKRLAIALDNVGELAGNANQLAIKLVPMVDDGREAARSVKTAAEGVSKTASRLNEKDGPIDRLAEGTAALAHAADSFNSATLPRLNRVTDDTSRAARQLSRTVNAINDNPQSLIFGNGTVQPGPGEAGFVPPTRSSQP